jgi:enamine deaminase RidA (YjgF/YER057c/UK114 family)
VSSEAVINNGTAYFAITPERPYDANLSAAEQARQTLVRLDARLAKLGSSKSKVMFVTIVLADMAKLRRDQRGPGQLGRQGSTAVARLHFRETRQSRNEDRDDRPGRGDQINPRLEASHPSRGTRP